MWKFLSLIAVPILLWGFSPRKAEDDVSGYPMSLSEYGFFEGNMADQKPVEGVMPYRLNTPLFSDYAHKLRFVKLPKGKTVSYNDQRVLQFPVGTTIIKTFYYENDERKPEAGRRLMETRLLIHEEKGWKAIPYHWNDEQTEAYLEVAGGTKEVKWRNKEGKKMKLDYTMPNMNQCKSCHSWDGEMTPIGPSARQLNHDMGYDHGKANQLTHWTEAGILEGLPAATEIPSVPDFDNKADGTLAERARAWLDINCAHCHNPHGPASTSGFFLDIHQDDPSVYGVFKTPVAAGRGSGDLDYDIHPGKADKSILVYRMESTDPGVMMPEVGRKLVHRESLDLIRAWINEMEK
ncbi:MAG: SO2930 family diheme c-type cytochrome [Bacteroidota bacterium]